MSRSRDRARPASRSWTWTSRRIADGLRRTLDDVLSRLRAGESVVVACRGGLGRTGTIVGCLLRDGGLDGDAAIALTRASRKNTIERDTQERFVRDWATSTGGVVS